MQNEENAPAIIDRAGDAQNSLPDPSLDNLRQILMRDQIERIADLEAELDRLKHQVTDEETLVQLIAPVLGDAIRLKIREARDEMIEALYPIIGKVVQRAVMEAVSDLARSLDAQVKSSFDLRSAWYRIRAEFSGAPEEQIRLRELLPFTVTDVLLIHRESGLLLNHLPGARSITSDTDLFSGMLTAIRDFAQDTLGGKEQSGLGEITVNDHRILIEAASHAYLAVIVHGVAPPGFRDDMRSRLIEIEHSHAEYLRSYQGDARPLLSVTDTLVPLMASASPRTLSSGQKRFLAAGASLLAILLVACGLFGNWVWQLSLRAAAAPVSQPVVAPPATLTVTPSPVPPTPTASLEPTATATPSPSPLPSSTPSPLPTSTFTPLPSATQVLQPAPFVGVLLGNVWLHTLPTSYSPRIGAALTLGERVELLAQQGRWVKVRRLIPGQEGVTGWIPARWFGATTAIPDELITPTAQ